MLFGAKIAAIEGESVKKIIKLTAIAAAIVLTASCGNVGDIPESSAQNTSNAAAETLPKEDSGAKENGESANFDGIQNSKKAIYGKNTGTDKTYTGLEPLPEVSFEVNDPQNTRDLSTEAFNHSFGVSKNGVPHSISVENQKRYDKYGALCLDTSGKKVIYLTFDCGYENGVTSQILDVLKAEKVPAAFFVTMPYLKSAPEIAARMIKEGHTVGNHSDTHPNFSKITRAQMAKEIETVDNFLRTKFGYSSPFFRFPEGACSENALELVQSLGFESVFWSSAYADWDVSSQKGADYAFNTVTARLHPGCVLLLHAVSKDNADALSAIIKWAKDEGYTFLPL